MPKIIEEGHAETVVGPAVVYLTSVDDSGASGYIKPTPKVQYFRKDTVYGNTEVYRVENDGVTLKYHATFKHVKDAIDFVKGR